jgi:Na+/H+-dicarboxylate symporter
MTRLQKFQRFASNPVTVLSCVVFGAGLGWALPDFSKHLGVVGALYIDLLKMIVLPFMLSAVIFSLQKLFRDGGTAAILKRVVLVFTVFSVVAALAGAIGTLAMQPGIDMSAVEQAALGRIVGGNVNSSDTEMTLYTVEAPAAPLSLREVLAAIVPSNIFASLANGETLKALVFALIFGFAVGQVPGRIADGFAQSLETIYFACQAMTRWINLPVPLVLICMTASQIADTGLEPMQTMIGFVVTFLVVSTLLLFAAVVVIGQRSGCSYATVRDAMREPFSLGVATNNSAICMPAMVEALSERLKFARSQVELLVPLSVSLLRCGAIVYFVCGTMFIAAIYGHALSPMEVGLIIFISVLSGFASSGMAGITSITLMGTACQYLGLPFEAAFILFVAVDPVCAMARTAVTVIGSCAAVSVVCPKPNQSVIS